jgi:hypothetical protein
LRPERSLFVEEVVCVAPLRRPARAAESRVLNGPRLVTSCSRHGRERACPGRGFDLALQPGGKDGGQFRKQWGLNFIVGGLVVVVALPGFVFFDGEIAGPGPQSVEVRIDAPKAPAPAAPAAPAKP